MSEDEVITRRDFITFKRSELTVDSSLQELIQREIGVSPDKLKLQMVFGNHVLTPEYMRDIGQRGINVVVGEFNRGDVLLFPYQSTTNPDQEAILKADTGLDQVKARLLDPGSGASFEERVYHYKAINALLNSGISIGALDVSIEEHRGKFPTLVPIAVGGSMLLMLSALPAYAALDKWVQKTRGKPLLAENLTRRHFLKTSALAATGVGLGLSKKYLDIAGVDLLKGKLVPRKIPLTEGRDSGKFNLLMGLEMNFEEARTRFGMDKNIFATYTEATVDFRNKVMALNLWHSLARYGQHKGRQIPNVYFMAGSGHEGVYKDFLSGIDKLEQQVAAYAQKLFTASVDEVLAIYDERVKTDPIAMDETAEEVIGDYIQSASQIFGSPFFIGKDIPYEAGAKLRRIPKTPRTIFIETLKNIIAKEEIKNDSHSKRRVMALKRGLAKTALSLEKSWVEVPLSTDSTTPVKSAEIPVSGEDLFQIKSSFLSSFQEFVNLGRIVARHKATTVLLPGSGYSHDDMQRVGIAKYREQFFPVARVMQIDPSRDLIEVGDRLLLPDNRYIELNHFTYVSHGDTIEPEKVSGVFVERKTWEGSSPHFYTVCRPENGPIEPTYHLDYDAQIQPNYEDKNSVTRSKKQVYYQIKPDETDWLPIGGILTTDIFFK